jgi:asparaginyl-tRNA synthetase
MVETEMVFADLEKITALAEKMIKYVVSYALENNIADLEYLEKHSKKTLIDKLKDINNKEFRKIDYEKCLEILTKNKNNFTYQDIK